MIEQCKAISIHAPCTGSDPQEQKGKERIIMISIHAPCTGSDSDCIIYIDYSA